MLPPGTLVALAGSGKTIRGTEGRGQEAKETIRSEVEVSRMRYIVLSNLGFFLTILALLGKSVWGKSVW